MSVQDPQEMSEWYEYIQQIPVEKLTDKAYAANSLSFVEALQEDGYSPQEIEDILYWFAERLDEEETTFVPSYGSGLYLNYQTLLADERGDSEE
jgi:hypothetical protein